MDALRIDSKMPTTITYVYGDNSEKILQYFGTTIEDCPFSCEDTGVMGSYQDSNSDEAK